MPHRPRSLRFALLAAIALLALTPACRRRGGGGGSHGRAVRAIDTHFLEQYAATQRFRLGTPTGIQLTPEGDAVLFLRSGPRSLVRDLYTQSVATGEERVLITAEQILSGAEEQLSPEERARRERLRLTARGIASYQLSEDGRRILVPLSGRLYVLERETGAVVPLTSPGGALSEARFSPDATRVAAVHDGDLYVFDIATGASRRLTTRSGPRVTNGTPEFVAQEEMDRFEGYWWSPDGQTIAYQETDTTGVEQLHVFDPTHPETPSEGTAYPRAGRANARVRLGLIPAAGGETTWVDWDRERFPYMARVVWSPAAPLTVLVQNREQTVETLLAIDPQGHATTLLTEGDPAWLNLDSTVPRWLPDGSGFLWSSERSGHWVLELRARDGSFQRSLIGESTGYREVLGLDPRGRFVLVLGGTDPTQTHLFRVSLDGGRPERITRTPGEWSAVFARRSGAHVRIHTSLTQERRFTVHRGNGTQSGTLRSVAERPSLIPRVELARVGPHQLNAAILRPVRFAQGQRCPVMVWVYGGPHSLQVTNDRGRYLLHQWYANLGFCVVAIDGRGTPHRGREWERALRGHTGDVPLEDQVEGLRALGQRFRELDLSRVGIQGWSYGGYMAAYALLRRPDVYRAAVAGAPVVDWRDYDTHYTERYLGLPDREAAAYDRASLLTYVNDLRRPLLLVHGTSDDNVYFLHAARFSDALFRAGRHHEFLPLVNFTHMVPDPVVTARLHTAVAQHFLRNL